MRSALVVAVLLAVLGACTASVVVPLVSTTDEDRALTMVPADAALYATGYIEPSLSQRRAIGELLSRFNLPREQVDALLQEAGRPLAEVGLDYQTDVKPWLGDQIALFVLPTPAGAVPNGAALIATRDVEATRAAVAKVLANAGVQPEPRTHGDLEYQVDPASGGAIGYIDDFLVVGTEGGFTAAADARQGPGLSSDPEYTATAGTLPTDNVLAAWFDPAALSGLAAAAAAEAGAPEAMSVPEAGLAQQQPTAVALRMQDDALVVESATLLDPNAPPALEFAQGGFLGELPAGSVAAIGIPALGQAATRLLDTVGEVPGGEGSRAIEEGFMTQTGLSLRNDVLRWMGDTGLFVSGSTPEAVTGGVTVASSDAAATARVVETLRQQAGSLGLEATPVDVGGLTGFTVQQGAPAPVTVVGGDRLVIGYGAGAVESVVTPPQRLADSPSYGAAAGALGGDWMPTFFIDMAAARTLGEAAAGGAPALGPTYAEEVAPRLGQISALIGGTRREGNTTRQRLAVVFTQN